MYSQSKFAFRLYRLLARNPRVLRLRKRYARQISRAGANLTPRRMEQQLRLTATATLAVAVAAPLALFSTLTASEDVFSRAIISIVVISISYLLITADAAKISAIREHLNNKKAERQP